MKELRLTNFNTIIGGKFKEMFVDDFLEIIDTRLGENYAVYYKKDKNIFIVVFDGTEYYLTLDKVIMDNYALGKYNNFTLKLKQLVDKVEEKEQGIANKEEISLRNEEIIKNAKNGLIPNDEAKSVYLDYLKNSKKFSFSKIKSYFSNLIEDFKSSHNLVDEWIWHTNIIPFKWMYEGVYYFLGSALVSILIVFGVTLWLVLVELSGSFNYNLFYWYLLLLLPQTTYLVPSTMFLGFQIKNRFNRLIDFIKLRKLNNQKIKQLTEELKIGRIQSSNYASFDKTLPEPIKEQNNPLEDNILKNLYDIVERLKYINLTDRKKLLDEAKNISKEYVERLAKIRDQDLEDGLQLGADNYFSLNQDILGRIASLEQRMYQIRVNEVDDENINKQYLTLTEAIDACYGDEGKIIGGERLPKTRKPSEINNNYIRGTK